MAFFPFYSQYDPDDCGVMALRMVCAWHGKELEPSAIREACQVPFGELSFLSLNQGAETLGFNALSVRLQPQQWDQDLVLPAIAHVFTQHFVVIIDITDKFVLLADPLRGMLKIERWHFQKEWLYGEPLHLLILNLEANADPQSVMVKPNEKVHIANWSSLNSAVLMLEALVLFLSLQWIGLSFSEPAPFPDYLVLGMGITLLLVSALLLIQFQWRQVVNPPIRRTSSNEDTKSLSSNFTESAYTIWIKAFHHERKAYLSHLPRAIVIIALLGIYTVWQGGVYGFWTLGLLSLFLWVSLNYSLGPKATFVRKADQWLSTLTTIDEQTQKAGIFQNVFTKWVSHELLWVLGIVWFLGLIAFGFLVPLSFQEGILLLSTGVAIGYYVYLFFLGIRAYQWRHYRPIPESVGYVKDDLPSGGDIQWRHTDHKEISKDITFPFGKSTLLAGPYERDLATIMQALQANSLDEGTLITYAGIPISKYNRESYLTRITVLSTEKDHLAELALTTINTDSQAVNLDHIASILMLPPSSIMEFLNTPQTDEVLELKRRIGKALILDPDWLLIDHISDVLNPFEEVIILENLIEIRRGRSTVIASNRAEIIPTVDQVVYVNLKDKILVEQKEDFESA